MGFYEQIASQYEQVTGGTERWKAAERFVDRLLERQPIASALDAACGTGAYALALAKRGVRTLGADLSEAMVARARSNADRAGLRADWLLSPMQELGGELKVRFDAVLCMGNSLPHLLSEADLRRTLAGFAGLLNPGGLAVIQLLNYDRVLARGERIVGIDRDGEKLYVRFYDFLAERVRFNLLRVDLAAGGDCPGQLDSTELCPWTGEQLAREMLRAGLEKVELYGDLAFGPFAPAESATVMLVARR